ncbi:hypothetical protein D3C77_706780 [compost metagenome]
MLAELLSIMQRFFRVLLTEGESQVEIGLPVLDAFIDVKRLKNMLLPFFQLPHTQ